MAEDRVFAAREGDTLAFVASAIGLVRVAVGVDGRVGRFSVVHSDTVTDVAGGDGALAVATGADVYVADPDADEEWLAATGFGPARAVGVDGDALVAAAPVSDDPDGPDGRVARLDGDAWTTLGTADVRAIDGSLVATAGGVCRLRSGLPRVGLDDARDVAAAGPYAATDAGLYALGNGWRREQSGRFAMVAAAVDGRVHAATADACFALDDDWTTCDLPTAERVADAAYPTDATYLVTVDGTFLADAGDGWRQRRLGVPDVRALAVPGADRATGQ